MLKGKTILLGVTGGIAAYKAADLASMLVKAHADVQVIMTKNAQQFINPITFETLTGNKCLVDTFDRNFPFEVEHIALAKRTDLAVIAPATANVSAKLAHGIADDMLTTTLLACNCPRLIAPAMNTRMFDNPVTQDNLALLERYGWQIIQPASGRLACGDTGRGKLAPVSLIFERVLQEAAFVHDLEGKKILVTAGPTRESVDPVRFLTNRSSGKMGYAIARMARMRGAQVTLVSGPTALEDIPGVEMVKIQSASDLFREVTGRAQQQDVIIKAAAVADYRPAEEASEKLHKTDDDLSIRLERTEDTLQHLGDHKREGQLLCGFAMETTDMEQRAAAKLKKKNLDMICGNNVKVEGAGFAGDTNVITIITKDKLLQLEKMTKEQAALRILDELAGMMNG